MALKATIFKAHVQISDVGRHYYDTHDLVIARHASETDDRMMVRLLAFVLNADPRLEFGRGLSTENEPDLSKTNYSGEIEYWIDVGRPSLDRIRKACGRAGRVIIYSYGGSVVDIWWNQICNELRRFSNLTVFNLKSGDAEFGRLANRNMSLQCTVNDGMVWLADDSQTVCVEYVELTP